MAADPIAKWLAHRVRVETPRLRLFCFPYAGAGASIYRLWYRGLPEDVEVCPVELPGRETRFAEAPLEDVTAIVDGAMNALAPLLVEPHALFGHSLGALVVFELARALRTAGVPPPLHLVVSAHRAPHLPLRRARLHELHPDELVARMYALGGTPAEVLENEELVELIAPLLRADFRAAETYRMEQQPPLESPILACGGSEDPHVPSSDLEAWSSHTRAGFALRMFPGNHFFCHSSREPLVAAVRSVLS
jgi:medium-chain acyl-[acyl-carrier-protein] hydrolase